VYGCGNTIEQTTAHHGRKIIALFDRRRESGMHLNRDKFKLHRNAVSYMGHELTPNGLRTDAAKIEAT
jgi:hypothetical protein